MSSSYQYSGPRCPFCAMPLTNDLIRTGLITCPTCRNDFEATAFTPPTRQTRIVEMAVVGPEGANACANHARNAAVTSCERCGLFICSLCEMNIGEGSFCPNCFQRARSEGTMQTTVTRMRDYASMAKMSAVLGIFMFALTLGVLFGPLAMYYSRKGLKQRREDNDPTYSMHITMVLGALELIGGIIYIGSLVVGGLS